VRFPPRRVLKKIYKFIASHMSPLKCKRKEELLK
jgi:hypothetical protein